MDLIRSIKRLVKALSEKSAPKPFDEEATVNRVDGKTVWVRLPGLNYDTPVEKTINVEAGDTVKVRSSGGRGWITGNNTSPPTDDKTANAAKTIARSAAAKAGKAQDEADKLVIITDKQGREIDAVIVTANGKNKTYHQASEPTGGEYAEGDVWFDTDDDNKMYRWNGSSWAAVVLGDDALESISANKITAGTINASQITVSNLDAGNITSGYLAAARIETGSLSISKTSGLQTALDGKAGTGAATGEEQLIYISKASGTPSVSQNTTWVTRSDDVQDTWTLKRPTYSSSYPVLFIAKQNKKVDGTVSCTTPVKDDTTTVIDGGHITTGTIDASVVTVSNLNAANITSGYVNEARIEAGSLSIDKTSGLQTALDGKAGTGAATGEEQLIYISKASGTPSVSQNTTWVTRSDDVQDTWTLKRPTYSSSYPVLFIAKQNKKVDGTVSCTTPVKDDTTTVIDGGHITTGTIDASVVTVSNLNAANITSGYLEAARIEAGSLSIGKTSGLQSALDDAGNTANNYLTEITGYSGISVHEAGDEDNFANVSSNGFLINGKVGGVSALAFRTYRGSFGTIRTQTASFNQATINYGYTEATFNCSYTPKMVLSVDFEDSQGPIQQWAEQPHKGENMSIRIDEANKKVVVSVDLTKYSGATLIDATIKYTSTNAVYSQLGYFPDDPDEHLFTIGNGYQDYSNAFTVDYDGDVNAQGTVKGNLEYCFLPPNSTYFQYYESNSPIMLKCSGNVCELRGAVKPYQEIAGSNTEYTICTLSDSKYYPSSGIKVTMHGSNRHEWLLRINTTGTVTFSRLADPAQNSYIAAGTSEWLPFHVTWLI